MPDARVALVGLFRTMFDPVALRSFCAACRTATTWSMRCPLRSGRHRPYAEGAVDELIDRGIERGAIFEALRAIGDERTSDIAAVEQIWTSQSAGETGRLIRPADSRRRFVLQRRISSTVRASSNSSSRC